MFQSIFNLNARRHAVSFQHQFVFNLYVERLYCNSPEKTDLETKLMNRKQLGGHVYQEEPGALQSKWRKPFSEKDSYWKSKFGLFSSKTFQASWTRYNPTNLKFFSFKQWRQDTNKEKMIVEQQFRKERLFILGCDLGAAHFAVFRGASVKFVNKPNWIKDDPNSDYDKDFPNKYDPEYIVEAIDFSGTSIVYEGVGNILNLKGLKWLSFSNCEFFDNWCLDRVSGEYFENLEYIDISHTKVTACGLNAMYRFQKLKSLKVDDESDDIHFYLRCLDLKRHMPELTIEGVSANFLEELDKEDKKAISQTQS